MGPVSTPADPPAVASARAYLRSGLPAIYHDGGGDPLDAYRREPLTLRFVGALERVLDPIVAVLDALDHHIAPDLAPPDMLELMAAWLGVELGESWPEERRRELVRRAAELHRMRGTAAGMRLALSIAFPDLPLRLEDGGGVTWSPDPDAAGGSPGPAPPGFVVFCDVPLDEPASLARRIEQLKPAHVPHRLRIRTRPASPYPSAPPAAPPPPPAGGPA